MHDKLLRMKDQMMNQGQDRQHYKYSERTRLPEHARQTAHDKTTEQQK